MGGIKETEDLITGIEVLLVKALGSTKISAAVKNKQWGELGGALAALATDKELQAALVEAYAGITQVPAEIKAAGIYEDFELGSDLLRAAQKAVAAYNSAHP